MEKNHENFLTNEESEFKQELACIHKKIMFDAVSSVYLILRTNEECEHWDILFADMYITVTYIIFSFLKQQQEELATVRNSLQSLISWLTGDHEPQLSDTSATESLQSTLQYNYF